MPKKTFTPVPDTVGYLIAREFPMREIGEKIRPMISRSLQKRASHFAPDLAGDRTGGIVVSEWKIRKIRYCPFRRPDHHLPDRQRAVRHSYGD